MPQPACDEMQTVLREISRHVEPSSQVFLGVAVDPRATDEVAVAVMASIHVGGGAVPDEDEFEETPAAEPAGGEVEAGEKPARQAPAKRPVKRVPAGQTQEELPLDQAMRGRFKGLDPTMVDGQDLDIPAYIRLRLRLK